MASNTTEIETLRFNKAQILLFAIKQKLNPGFANKNGFEHKVYCSGLCCTINEFLAMFPQAKHFPMKANCTNRRLKLQSRYKMFEATFHSIKNLDYLFKEIDPEWDMICDDDSVGFAYKISFRLIMTTLNSHRRKLENGIPGELVYHTSITNSTLNCTIYRSYISRWTVNGDDSDWKTKVLREQTALEEK